METSCALLAICEGNSSVPSEFPAQRPVTRSFDVFFDLRLNKRLNKQWWGWWFIIRAHSDVIVMIIIHEDEKDEKNPCVVYEMLLCLNSTRGHQNTNYIEALRFICGSDTRLFHLRMSGPMLFLFGWPPCQRSDVTLMEVSQDALDSLYIRSIWLLYIVMFFVNLIWYLYLFWLNKHCLSLSESETLVSHYIPANIKQHECKFTNPLWYCAFYATLVFAANATYNLRHLLTRYILLQYGAITIKQLTKPVCLGSS